MAKSYKVSLGAQAFSFHDQNTGFSITKGEVKELTAKQYASKKIRNAINNGYLQMVTDGEGANPYTDSVVTKLKKKLETQVSRGLTLEKMSKSYSMEDLKHIAKTYDIEPEEGDTPSQLLEAIVSEIQNNE